MNFDEFENFCEDVRFYIHKAIGITYFVEGYFGDRCTDEETQHKCAAMDCVMENLVGAEKFINKRIDHYHKIALKGK